MLNWQNNTQVFRQIHVFLKTVYDVLGNTSTHLRKIWNGAIYNKLNFLMESKSWKIIKITVITIKTNLLH